MTRPGLGFITHHELDCFLGGPTRGPQQRRRWAARHWLPEPHWIRGDRAPLAVFPEVTLAPLAVARPREHTSLLEALTSRCEILFASRAFMGLSSALHNVLAVDRAAARDVGRLAELLVEHERDALEIWRACVADVEGELARELDLVIDVRPGRIVEADATAYLVELAHGGAERWVRASAPLELDLGTWVTCDRLIVGGSSRAFLLPVAPEVIDVEDLDVDGSHDQEEEEIGRWFAQMMRVTDAQSATEIEEEPVEPVYHRPPLVSRGQSWRGGSTMATLRR
jgi:hypothetical protein